MGEKGLKDNLSMKQLPAAIVMVRPASFGFNPETANTILYQREITDNSRKEIERRARIEFDMLAGRLGEEIGRAHV